MIDVRPIALPAWANPEIQVETLRRDLGYSAGQRDDEIKAAFSGALGSWGGPAGTLGRQLVPAVVRSPLPANRSDCFLRLPPVIEIIGFERVDGSAWVEAADVTGRLDEDRLYWRSAPGLRVVAHHGYLDRTVPANLLSALRLMVRQVIDGEDEGRSRAIKNLLSGLKVYA